MTSELKVDKITPASGTNTQIGEAGDTTNLSAGTVTLPTSIITGQTEKTTLVDADKFLISDSAASGAFKYVQKSNLPGGGLQFITAVNTTVTSVITFENCFSSTYKNYAIFFTNINFSSDSDLGFRFGSSGGYDADYKGASHGYESGQVGTAYNSGQTYAKPAGALFGVDTAANSQQGMTGSGIIYNPFDSSSAVYGTFQVGCRNEANSQWVIANSWFTNNSDQSYTNLRAYSTSSNDFNTHGRIAIYGIVDS